MELNNNPVKIKTAEEISNTAPKAGTEAETETGTGTEAGIETKVKVSESITYRDVNYII